MMNQGIEFFSRLFKSADGPPRRHCGQWSSFHASFYIVSGLLIIRFLRLYFLFAAFILACDVTQLITPIIKCIKILNDTKEFRMQLRLTHG